MRDERSLQIVADNIIDTITLAVWQHTSHELIQEFNRLCGDNRARNLPTLVFLDDERAVDQSRICYGDVDPIVVRDYWSFVRLIPIFDSFEGVIVSFDHDIQCFDTNGREKTGKDCLVNMIDHFVGGFATSSVLPQCVFHTANIVGCANMTDTWNSFVKYWEELHRGIDS